MRLRVKLDFVVDIRGDATMNPVLNDGFESAVRALWPHLDGADIEPNGHASFTTVKRKKETST